VLYDQRQRQHEFGPGWTDEGIRRYLNAIYEMCPLLQTFLDIGRYIAESVCDDDPYSGVVVTNPFEGAKICWNPVPRRRRSLISAARAILEGASWNSRFFGAVPSKSQAAEEFLHAVSDSDARSVLLSSSDAEPQ
jgi:hypothetical protein